MPTSPASSACSRSPAVPFTDADAHHAVLVSEQFARDHFGGTQAALGQMLQVESEPVEIVGLLPGGFDFPAGTQVWEAFPSAARVAGTDGIQL